MLASVDEQGWAHTKEGPTNEYEKMRTYFKSAPRLQQRFFKLRCADS